MSLHRLLSAAGRRRSPHGPWGCSALYALPLAVATLLAGIGCASNPATGKQQLNFYSKSQEIALGRESAQQVDAQLGLVEDEALQTWVAGIGQQLAAASERPDLPWTFKVVDDPVVNAFALPGGFIYVTRGILGHLENEAELAGVLGHEIGHVTAQHSVNQMSKQQLATGGLLVGMILSPEVAQVGDLAQTGLGLLFLKFSRDDESQADKLGLRYMSKAGFETREMPNVFEVLRRVSQASGAGRIPGWLSTHPDPGNRLERTRELIAKGSYAPGRVERETYFRHIDGLAFGADPRQGYFEGTRYYHPGLRFQFDLPSGWPAINEAADVAAIHPEKIAQLQLALAPGTSADQALQQFLSQQGIEVGAQQRLSAHGVPLSEATFRAPRQGAEALTGHVGFLEHDGKVFEILGLSLESNFGRVDSTFQQVIRSFAPLADPAHLAVEPQRIDVVELPRAMSFQEFLRAYPSGADAGTVALANGIEDQTATLAAGTLLKRIEGHEVGTQRIGPELQ